MRYGKLATVIAGVFWIVAPMFIASGVATASMTGAPAVRHQDMRKRTDQRYPPEGFSPRLTCGTQAGLPGGVSGSTAISRAESWVSTNVPYDQGACYTNAYGQYREDCSGFVSMAWGLTSSFTTSTLGQVSHQISKAQMTPGDIVLIPGDHTELFVSWADSGHTRANFDAETQPGEGTVHDSNEPVYSGYFGNFAAYRYNHLKTSSAVVAPVGSSNWVQSSNPVAFGVYQSTSGGTLKEAAWESNKWSGWDTNLGTTVTGPVAVDYSDGSYHIFGLDAEGKLYWRGYTATAGWNSWSAIYNGGRQATFKAGTGLSAAVYAGFEHIFGIVPDGGIAQVFRQGSSEWQYTGWGGSNFVATPAINVTDGRVDVYANMSNGIMYQRTYRYNSGFTVWHSNQVQGATMRFAPGTGLSGVYATGREQVFGISLDHTLRQMYYSDPKLGWQTVNWGGQLEGSPAVTASGSQVDVFAKTGGGIYQRYYDGRSFSHWSKQLSYPV